MLTFYPRQTFSVDRATAAQVSEGDALPWIEQRRRPVKREQLILEKRWKGDDCAGTRSSSNEAWKQLSGGHPEVNGWRGPGGRRSHRAHSQQAGSARGFGAPTSPAFYHLPNVWFPVFTPSPVIFRLSSAWDGPWWALPEGTEWFSEFFCHSPGAEWVEAALPPRWRMHGVATFYNECMRSLACTRDSLSHS